MALIPKGYRPEDDPPEKKDSESKKTEQATRSNENTRLDDAPEEDGRNKEWQDRSRVNLERPNPDAKTNLERDFEPESPGYSKDDTPIY